MVLTISFWGGIGVLGILLVTRYFLSSQNNKRKINVLPTRWPLLGMLPNLLLNAHRLYDWLTEIMVATGGNYMFYGPKFSGLNYFFTADPRNVEHILKNNFSNYPKGQDFRDISHELLGQGIITVDGDMWRAQRQAASIPLNSGVHRRYSDAVLFSAAETKLLTVLRHVSALGIHVDLQDIMTRFTFDTVCHVAFGVDTGCLVPQLPDVPFAMAFGEALDCSMDRFFLPSTWWKMMRWMKIGKERRLPAAVEKLDNFISEIISGRRAKLAEIAAATSSARESDDGAIPEHGDLLSCVMKLESENTNNDRVLKDLCLNLLFAGRDTSALALGWLFWLLATHPEKEARVVDEINREMKLCTNGRLSRDVLNRMTYLHAAINETLRLYPSVPVDLRQTVEADVMPDGTRLAKGQRFVYSLYSMGRMESIWGGDCREFRPERWFSAEKPGELIHVSPFKFPAFNGGPRNCIGKDMGYVLMKAVAVSLLRSFKVVLVPGHVVEPKMSATIYMKNGLLVSVHPRPPKV